MLKFLLRFILESNLFSMGIFKRKSINSHTPIGYAQQKRGGGNRLKVVLIIIAIVLTFALLMFSNKSGSNSSNPDKFAEYIILEKDGPKAYALTSPGFQNVYSQDWFSNYTTGLKQKLGTVTQIKRVSFKETTEPNKLPTYTYNYEFSYSSKKWLLSVVAYKDSNHKIVVDSFSTSEENGSSQ